MTDLITKQDYLNEIEKWDCPVKKPTMKMSKPEIISFYEQYKPREDNIQTPSIEESTPFTAKATAEGCKIADLIETGINEIKTNVGEEISNATENQESGGMVGDGTPSKEQQKKQPTCASDVINLMLEKHRKNK